MKKLFFVIGKYKNSLTKIENVGQKWKKIEKIRNVGQLTENVGNNSKQLKKKEKLGKTFNAKMKNNQNKIKHNFGNKNKSWYTIRKV